MPDQLISWAEFSGGVGATPAGYGSPYFRTAAQWAALASVPSPASDALAGLAASLAVGPLGAAVSGLNLAGFQVGNLGPDESQLLGLQAVSALGAALTSGPAAVAAVVQVQFPGGVEPGAPPAPADGKVLAALAAQAGPFVAAGIADLLSLFPQAPPAQAAATPLLPVPPVPPAPARPVRPLPGQYPPPALPSTEVLPSPWAWPPFVSLPFPVSYYDMAVPPSQRPSAMPMPPPPPPAPPGLEPPPAPPSVRPPGATLGAADAYAAELQRQASLTAGVNVNEMRLRPPGPLQPPGVMPPSIQPPLAPWSPIRPPGATFEGTPFRPPAGLGAPLAPGQSSGGAGGGSPPSPPPPPPLG